MVATARRSAPDPRPSQAASGSPTRASLPVAAALYDAMQELVRVYQFRDRDRACCGRITPNECYALETIERAGGATVNELAAALGLHKSNASRIVDALEAKRLARRKAVDGDARRVRVEITARGTTTHAAIRAGVEARYDELLAQVPSASKTELVELVRALGREAAARIGRGCASSTEPGRRSGCS